MAAWKLRLQCQRHNRTTPAMDDTAITTEESIQHIQIARHFLDGADVAWVQKRFNASREEIETGWSSVVAMLEQALQVPSSEVTFFVLPERLSPQTEACLRQLLAWQEQYRQRQFTRETTPDPAIDPADANTNRKDDPDVSGPSQRD